jgi:hypothetical protein
LCHISIFLKLYIKPDSQETAQNFEKRVLQKCLRITVYTYKPVNPFNFLKKHQNHCTLSLLLENSNKIVIAPGSASTILKRFSMQQSSESLHEFKNIINDSGDCLHPSKRELTKLHSVNECLQEFRERKVNWILRDPYNFSKILENF